MTIQAGGAGNGTTAPYASGTHQFSFGQEVTLTATPYDSSTFDLWGITTNIAYKTGSSSSTNPATFIINGTGTITANYKLKTYNVTVTNANTGWGTVSANGTVEYGKNFTISATPVTNYDFDKWTITSGSTFATLQSAATSASNALVAVKGAVTVQASFKPKNYFVTINANGTGTGTLSQSSQNVPYNGTITITATPTAPGNNFGGWAFTPTVIEPVDGNANSQTEEFRALGTGTITATFNKNTYQIVLLSYNTDYGTVVTSTPQTIAYDSTFTIEASKKRGCKFTGWTASPSAVISFGNSDSTKTTARVTGAATITANFQQIKGAPNVLYVDQNAVWTSSPSPDTLGKNWFNSYKDLQAALTAGANKEVWVAAGTYSPATTTPFTPVSNSKIYGGFNAAEEIRDARNFVVNRTILDAGLNNKTTIDINNLQKIVFDGFLLTGAKNEGFIVNCYYPDSILFSNSSTT